MNIKKNLSPCPCFFNFAFCYKVTASYVPLLVDKIFSFLTTFIFNLFIHLP